MKRSGIGLMLGLSGAVMLLSACSHTPIPVAETYPITTQQRMQAAHHWELLAEHVAGKIAQNMPQPNPAGVGAFDTVFAPAPVEPASTPVADVIDATPTPPGGDMSMSDPVAATENLMSSLDSMMTLSTPPVPSIYVSLPRKGQATTFGRAFHNMLRTQLVKRGIAVSNNPNAVNSNCPSINTCKPMILDYDIQVVQHKDRSAHMTMPGAFSLSAAGIWMVAQIVDTWVDPEWAVVPVALALDANAARQLRFPGQTNTEVVISTSLADGDLVVFGETNIYYVNTGDQDHYERGARTLKVVDR
ncbi:MAG: hypothetical protein AAF512_18840 [Pseudomonadota bacterium]